MKLSVIITAASLLFLCGCGTIHVFNESHIHIEKRVVIDSDDQTVSTIIDFINKMQAMSQPKEEPLSGFVWDEKILKKHKGETEDE